MRVYQNQANALRDRAARKGTTYWEEHGREYEGYDKKTARAIRNEQKYAEKQAKRKEGANV